MTVFPPRRFRRRTLLGLPAAVALAAVTVPSSPAGAAPATRASAPECVADLITAEPSLVRGA